MLWTLAYGYGYWHPSVLICVTQFTVFKSPFSIVSYRLLILEAVVGLFNKYKILVGAFPEHCFEKVRLQLYCTQSCYAVLGFIQEMLSLKH